VLHGGEGFYDEFYIRDGAYQMLELEEAGLIDAARKLPTSASTLMSGMISSLR